MSREERGLSRPFRARTARGIDLHVETDATLPLVDVSLLLRGGAAQDPEGKEGVARLHARLLRRGTRRFSPSRARSLPAASADELDEAIESLGGTLSIDVTPSAVRVGGTVIRRNLEPFVALLASLLAAPALRRADLAYVKREADAQLAALADEDRWLASRALRHTLFGAHPYGRSMIGTRASIAAIRHADVLAHHEALVRSDGLVVGMAGDVSPDLAQALVARYLHALPRGPGEDRPIADAPRLRGLHVVLVDKPDRAQAQLLIGARGVRLGEPAFYPMVVANTVFGGTFSARLVKAVRSERGYSYTATSRLHADRARDAWIAYTHPSIDQLRDCLALELELVRDFVSGGVRAREVAFAKSYLEGSHAFERDTASKRLEPHLEASLFSIGERFFTRPLEHVRAVDAASASRAVRRVLGGRDGRADDLVVAVLAPRKLERSLASLPGITSFRTIPHLAALSLGSDARARGASLE